MIAELKYATVIDARPRDDFVRHRRCFTSQTTEGYRQSYSIGALKHLLENGDTIAVNLGAGRGASVRQVVDMVQYITGREIVARDAPRRAGDPPALVADPKKAAEVLDWMPRRSELAAVITDAWHWHNKRFGTGST